MAGSLAATDSGLCAAGDGDATGEAAGLATAGEAAAAGDAAGDGDAAGFATAGEGLLAGEAGGAVGLGGAVVGAAVGWTVADGAHPSASSMVAVDPMPPVTFRTRR